MRFLAITMAALLLGGGCVANTYRIPNSELQQLAQTKPEERGKKVRVIQEIGQGTVVNNTERVGVDTQIIFVPQININTGPRYQRGGVAGGGRVGGGGTKIGGGGSGSDGKAAAIAILVIAIGAMFVVAGIEGSRYDGHAQLHPMHPVHLIGKDGGYTIMPLAWIDPQAAEWTHKAIVRPQDGPWNPLGRGPLDRTGPTYGVYGGTGTLRSADGTNGAGPAFTIQLGYYFNQYIGLMGDLMFAWRTNSVGGVLYESRYMLELQVMPLQAGIFHAGGYVGAGWAYRFEDDVLDRVGNNGTGAQTAGAMVQLDINTRIALTARMGITKAHEAGFGQGNSVTDRMTDIIFGLSIY
jgi:hypothetical protein